MEVKVQDKRTGEGKVAPVHAMKAQGRVVVPLHSFLTSSLDGD
jgi:hypothetical protein